MNFFETMEHRLALPPEETAKVLAELRSHFEDSKDELIDSGMSEEDASREAERRLGDPERLADRLRLAHLQRWRVYVNRFPLDARAKRWAAAEFVIMLLSSIAIGAILCHLLAGVPFRERASVLIGTVVVGIAMNAALTWRINPLDYYKAPAWKLVLRSVALSVILSPIWYLEARVWISHPLDTTLHLGFMLAIVFGVYLGKRRGAGQSVERS